MQGPPLLEPGKLEHLPETAALPGSDGIRCPEDDGEVAERGRITSVPLPQENRPPVLEHDPCRHPLASLLVSVTDLEAVVQVECVTGCGHRLYSDRGPLECPCHWPAARVARGLQQGRSWASSWSEGQRA